MSREHIAIDTYISEIAMVDKSPTPNENNFRPVSVISSIVHQFNPTYLSYYFIEDPIQMDNLENGTRSYLL